MDLHICTHFRGGHNCAPRRNPAFIRFDTFSQVPYFRFSRSQRYRPAWSGTAGRKKPRKEGGSRFVVFREINSLRNRKICVPYSPSPYRPLQFSARISPAVILLGAHVLFPFPLPLLAPPVGPATPAVAHIVLKKGLPSGEFCARVTIRPPQRSASLRSKHPTLSAGPNQSAYFHLIAVELLSDCRGAWAFSFLLAPVNAPVRNQQGG